MDEKTRESIALFRYGIISPLLNGQREAKSYLEEESQKIHTIPYWGERRIAAKTMMEWLYKYRKEGFEGIKPKSRLDKGNSRRLSPDHQDHIVTLRKQSLDMPVTVFYEQLIKSGEIMANEVSYSTIRRLIKKHHLTVKPGATTPERKRFAYDRINILWQTDLSHGPYIPVNGRQKKTFLIAYIDDCSRLVPYAQFFTSEGFDGIRTVTKEAFIRRGLPKMIYADNGKIFRSETLQFACAQVGVTLTHTQPYDPQSKGKIERFFHTVQTRFYPLLKANPVDSLEALNERFGLWLEEDYHRRVHASLDGRTPHEVFQHQLETVRFLEDVSILNTIFLKREQRKVKPDGTISLNKKLYEVPPRFVGQTIDIRLNESDVFIYEEGKEVAKILPVIFKDNANVKRERSLSFSKMRNEKGGEADV
ncbi:MAG: DDE-type integrase/transposase/recombinase [Heyndrickxia sp.]